MKPTPNVSIVQLTDGREVCLSYGVIVAAFVSRNYAMQHFARQADKIIVPTGYLKTSRKYSAMTSKHANAYAGPDAIIVDDAVLRALVAPVTDNNRR